MSKHFSPEWGREVIFFSSPDHRYYNQKQFKTVLITFLACYYLFKVPYFNRCFQEEKLFHAISFSDLPLTGG